MDNAVEKVLGYFQCFKAKGLKQNSFPKQVNTNRSLDVLKRVLTPTCTTASFDKSENLNETLSEAFSYTCPLNDSGMEMETRQHEIYIVEDGSIYTDNNTSRKVRFCPDVSVQCSPQMCSSETLWYQDEDFIRFEDHYRNKIKRLSKRLPGYVSSNMISPLRKKVDPPV